jgi:hypothetical protein
MGKKGAAVLWVGLLATACWGFKAAEIVPDYFPLKPGRVLTYQEQATDGTRAVGRRVMTFLPPEVSAGMGGVVFPVKEDSTGSIASLPYITTLYYKRTGRGYVYSTSRESLDYLFLPEDLHLGKKWRLKNDSRFPVRQVVSVDDEVATPLGTYRCVKVSQEDGWEFWFAAGVGLVKAQSPKMIMTLASVVVQ